MERPVLNVTANIDLTISSEGIKLFLKTSFRLNFKNITLFSDELEKQNSSESFQKILPETSTKGRVKSCHINFIKVVLYIY